MAINITFVHVAISNKRIVSIVNQHDFESRCSKEDVDNAAKGLSKCRGDQLQEFTGEQTMSRTTNGNKTSVPLMTDSIITRKSKYISHEPEGCSGSNQRCDGCTS